MTVDEARRIATDLGFDVFIDLHKSQYITSAVKEALKSGLLKTLCGVYLQFRRDGTLYIGQAHNLTRRQEQHRYASHQLDYLAFYACTPKRLDYYEQYFIDRAVRLNIDLVNQLLKPIEITNDRNLMFDDCLSPDEQDAFIERIANGHFDDRVALDALCKQAEPEVKNDWQTFCTLPNYTTLLDHAARFVRQSIPAAHTLAGLFWDVQVMNHTPNHARLNVLRIHCGWFVPYAIFHFKSNAAMYFLDIALPHAIYDEKELNNLIRRYNWVGWHIPISATDSPPNLDKVQPKGLDTYTSPQAKLKDYERAVTQATFGETIHLTMPLAVADYVLSDPMIAKGCAIFCIASMRRASGRGDPTHNPVAMTALLNRLRYFE